MPILSINPLNIGSVGNDPTQYMINTSDTLATVTTAGYLTEANKKPWAFQEGDYAAVKTTNSGTQICQIILTDGVVSLSPFEFASVTLQGTTHQISVVQSPVGTWTISTPQDIDVTSSVTFDAAQLSSINSGDYSTVVIADTSGNLSSVTPTASTPRYIANTGASNAPAWDRVDISTSGITGVLPVANGGTNSSTALTNGLFMVSNGGSIVEVNQDTSMGNFKITNLADPTQPSDAVNKNYADNLVSGLSYKSACVCATAVALPACTYNNGSSGVGATLTANANGALTVDDIVLATNDRVLIKNQVATANNGIYVVTATGSAGTPFVLTRALDFNQVSEIPVGATTFIATGTVNEGTTWSQTAVVVTIGTSPITFVQVGGSAAVTIIGTTNQINVMQVGATYTLSTPQDIALTSNVTFNSATLSGLTASQLVATDGSKTLQTLTTATYPSLTEISYVKGVTSSIQDQLNAKGVGTVTSVAMTVPTFLSVSGSPVTTTGTLAVSLSGTALPVANGGTGQTSYTNGQLLIGNTTGNTLSLGTLTATANQTTITNGAGSITVGTVQDINTSSSPTFTGLNLSGLTASQAVVTDGSKNLASLGYVSTANTASFLAQRDSSGNLYANNFVNNYTSTVGSGQTITMTSSSSQYQLCPSGTVTYTLPAVSTIPLGTTYIFYSLGGTMTINSSGGNQVGGTGLANTMVLSIQSNATTGTSAAVWNIISLLSPFSNGGSTVVRDAGGSVASTSYKSTSSNLSTVGVIRLGSSDIIFGIRNNANSANLSFTKNTSDVFNLPTQLTIGAASSATGTLGLLGTTSGAVTIQPQAAAGTYNFNLPTTAGTAGQVLTSQAGGATAMTWTTWSDAFPVFIQTVANDTYVIQAYTPYAGTITGCGEIARALGTAGTFAIQINGVNVTGLTAVVPTTGGSFTAASAANTFAAGAKIQIVYTGTTAILDHSITINVTRP